MKKAIKRIVSISALATAGIHIANCVIEESSTRKNILNKRDGHLYHWKYGDIFYTKEGNGSPLLLVHNLTPDSSGYEWIKMKHMLSKEYTVYTIDLLGCGRSAKPNMTYTNFLYVQLINDFIEHVIGKKTDVITSGHSSTFVLMSNLMNESSINRLILINPPSIEERCKLGKKNGTVYKIIMSMPILGTYLYNILMRKTYIKNQCNNDYCSKYYFVTSDMIDAYYESAHLDQSKGRYLFASIFGHYTNVNVTKAVTEFKNPIHIIESEDKDSHESVLNQYQRLNEAITGTTVLGTECLPQIEAPRKTYGHISEFLTK